MSTRFLLRFLGLLATIFAGAVLAAMISTDRSIHPWQLGAVAAGAAWLGMWFVHRLRWDVPAAELRESLESMRDGRPGAKPARTGTGALHDIANLVARYVEEAKSELDDAHHWRQDLQGLFGLLPDPILLADAHRRIVLINDAASKLFNISRVRAANEPLIGVISDQPIVQMLQELLPEGKPLDLQPRELRLLRSGQRMTFQAMARRTASGNLLLVLRDISAVSSSLQMKADFVANASHELRTPIAAMKISLEMIQDLGDEDPEQSKKCVAILAEHMRRLEEMITDLLDLSRVESAHLRPSLQAVSPEASFNWVKGILADLAREKNVPVQLEIAEGFPTVQADDRLIQLILRNLVENALKFTSTGAVTVFFQRSRLPGFFELGVRDTGIGIPAEHLDRVFERFYQVDSARSGSAKRGTGLGLAIVKHAVAAMDGTVKIESELGKGTTVTCALPMVHE